jgi:hypothetical protein
MEHNGIAGCTVPTAGIGQLIIAKKHTDRTQWMRSVEGSDHCPTTRRVSVRGERRSDLGAWSPCAKQQAEVSAVDNAVKVQVAEASSSPTRACAPCAKHETKVCTGDNPVKIQVAEA